MKYSYFLALALSAVIFNSCTNSSQAPQPTATPATGGTTPASATATAGQRIFEEKCAACHGSDGTAGIGNAANLHTSRLSTAAIVNTISNGRGGMPSFKSQVNGADIQDLANYVVLLRK